MSAYLVIAAAFILAAFAVRRAVRKLASWLRYRWWLLRLEHRENGATRYERIPVEDWERNAWTDIVRGWKQDPAPGPAYDRRRSA